jgi:general L-amino acid transport system permease protein
MALPYRLRRRRVADLLFLWWDIRLQRLLFQAAFAAVVLTIGYVLFSNLDRRVDELGLDLFPFVSLDASFPFVHVEEDFLGQRAGFSIDDRTFGFDYSANDDYVRAFQAGLLNTIQISFIGILLATALGILAGVARLSTNWLVSRVALVYVETFRNVPLLVQLIFWYLAVFLKAPRFSDSLDVFGLAFLSNRAVAIPAVGAQGLVWVWLLILLGGLIVARLVGRLRMKEQEATGQPGYPLAYAAGTFLVIAAAGFLVTGLPLTIDTPERGQSAYAGGWQMTPEYAALLTGLVLYTGAFIAEIVRGSILAIPKAQTEASAALGLTAFQRLRYVILPQALKIIIPPLTNQYLNLTKNSSLAVAVAFKDFFDVARVSINQTGQAVPIITLVMLTYLMMSLTISVVMNFLNSRLKWGTR